MFGGKYYHGTVTNYQKKAGWYALLASAQAQHASTLAAPMLHACLRLLEDMARYCSRACSAVKRPSVFTLVLLAWPLHIAKFTHGFVWLLHSMGSQSRWHPQTH